MSHTNIVALLLVASMSPISAVAQPAEAETLAQALARGDTSVDLRYRYEFVDSDVFDLDAHASTLRTALGYRTLPFKGFSFFAQAQNVSVIGDDKYNNRGAAHLSNGVRDRPVVADPSQTRMQQAYLRIDAFDTAVDVGRREIFYGDHRFIGDVRWRQNHQTFDALHLSSKALDRTTLSYTFVDRVVRIFGDEKEMSSHFLNGLVQVKPDISIEMFAYLLDYQEEQDFNLSSQTYGFRALGEHAVRDNVGLVFEAEYARQADYASNTSDLGASYLELMGGVDLKRWVRVKVGREFLGAAEGRLAFQTPLATGHKFNGWADRFLVTPRDGLVDWYVSANGALRKLSWVATYHSFSADGGGRAYGSELDAQATYPTSWRQSFAFKFALYRENGFASDVSKIWLWTQYSF